MEKIIPEIKPGMQEREVATELEYQMKKGGAEGASFPILVAGGERAALPHAAATERKLKKDEFFFVDFGCTLDGYQTDQTLTMALGKPKGELNQVYDIVKEAHDRAIAYVRPGVKTCDVDSVARSYISEQGYGEHFTHGVGHGVGIEVHEFPRISFRTSDVLEVGMTLTIEPGIYLPKLERSAN